MTLRVSEVRLPAIAAPAPGQVWAIEAERPKAAARTARTMGGLLSPMRYAQVTYLTTPLNGSVGYELAKLS